MKHVYQLGWSELNDVVAATVDQLNADRLTKVFSQEDLVTANLALGILSPHDGSPCWNAAGGLAEMERWAEAAAWYIEAARRFRQAEGAPEALPDEAEWADSALSHAAHAYLQVRQTVLARAVILHIVEEDQQREAQDELEELEAVGYDHG